MSDRLQILKTRLTQKVSFCFFMRGEKFRRITPENYIPPTPAERAPPVHKATGGHGFPYVTLLNPYIVTKIK